uniref:PDZ domain-containing protein n=1 Tax=Rhizochromulina marina TaxID=1034831 RepID=A0A7S2RUG2_9STRA
MDSSAAWMTRASEGDAEGRPLSLPMRNRSGSGLGSGFRPRKQRQQLHHRHNHRHQVVRDATDLLRASLNLQLGPAHYSHGLQVHMVIGNEEKLRSKFTEIVQELDAAPDVERGSMGEGDTIEQRLSSEDRGATKSMPDLRRVAMGGRRAGQQGLDEQDLRARLPSGSLHQADLEDTSPFHACSTFLGACVVQVDDVHLELMYWLDALEAVKETLLAKRPEGHRFILRMVETRSARIPHSGWHGVRLGPGTGHVGIQVDHITDSSPGRIYGMEPGSRLLWVGEHDLRAVKFSQAKDMLHRMGIPMHTFGSGLPSSTTMMPSGLGPFSGRLNALFTVPNHGYE